MSHLSISLACWNYDRTRALHDGRVRAEGLDINFIPLHAEEVFFRMARFHEFDVAELSLSTYVVSLFMKEPPFVAIPVFPSRMFRHSGIFINNEKNISKPSDIRGRKVGLPEYQLTGCVWMKGIMADEYGVPVDSVSYFTGSQEEKGRIEKLSLDLPQNISIQKIREDQTLTSMLGSGDIDILYSPRAPSNLSREGKLTNVVRLFDDYENVEKEYFRKTSIFPIMHTIAIRKDVYERNPWIAKSLYKAFVEAQKLAYEELSQTNQLVCMLPWQTSHFEEARRLMGKDYWPYGLHENRKTIETFLRYSYEQGLSKKLLAPEDIFVRETQETFKI